MNAVSRLARACVILGATAILQVMAPAATALPASIATPECADASELIELGEPAVAMDVIKSLRAAHAEPAEGLEPLCAPEYERATAHQARAAALARWANIASDAADAVGSPDLPLAPPSCNVPGGAALAQWQRTMPTMPDEEALTSAIKDATADALACDRQSKTALVLDETLSAPAKKLPDVANKTWGEFKKVWLDPWVPILGALLGCLAVGMVLARALLLLVTRDVATLITEWGPMRPLLMGLGWLTLLVGAGVGVGVWDLLAMSPGLSMRKLETDEWLALAFVVVAVFSVVQMAALPAGTSTAAGFRMRWDTRRAFWLCVMLFCSILAMVIFFTNHDFHTASTLNPRFVAGSVTTAVGAFVLALGWSAGRAITVTSSGEGAPKQEELRALLQRLAPDSPRGVEVPVGTDADLLSAIGLADGSSNPFVAAMVRVLKLLRPPTPWQLVVTASSAANIQVALTRNHRLVESFSTETRTTFRFLGPANPDTKDGEVPAKDDGKAADPAVTDLAPFAAALAVVRIATETGATKGLAGATKWRSVALQYLGAQQPTGSPTAQAIWSESVSQDPDNLFARTGYWHSLYREAESDADLKTYSDLLDGLLNSVESSEAGQLLVKEPALMLRLRYVRVAVGINRLALTGPSNGQAPTDLMNHADKLDAQLSDPGIDADFREPMKHRVQALLLSLSTETHFDYALKTAQPENEGPFVNYSLACYHAWKASDPARAIRHLKVADSQPSLRAWRDLDPQLATLRTQEIEQILPEPARRTNAYRKAYGTKLPTDVLAVEPFNGYADKLRAAGLVTLERISNELTDGIDPDLPPAVVSWLKRVAQLGVDIKTDDDLRPWHLVLMSVLAAKGVLTQEQAKEQMLLPDLEKALQAYQSSPRVAVLHAWLVSPVVVE